MPDKEEDDALVQLAATVAHELNNIFTAVSGNLSLLEDSLDHGSRAKVVGDVIQTARRGIELSEKLQAFAGRQKLNRTQFDVNHVVAATFADLKRSAVLPHIDVELGLTSVPCFVATDEEKFTRVLEELARNAAAAMDNHGRLVVCTTAATLKQGQVKRLAPGAYVRLNVKDTGRGMSPEVAKRALDPLFSTKAGHHGWGLARCAGFIRQSGGDILLSSHLGKGTIAEVLLPRIISHSAPTASI